MTGLDIATWTLSGISVLLFAAFVLRVGVDQVRYVWTTGASRPGPVEVRLFAGSALFGAASSITACLAIGAAG